MHALLEPVAPAPTLRRRSDRERRAADVIVEILLEAGVDTVFGLPGGAVAPIFDALLGEPRIKVIIAKHESACAFSAIGYARATGKIGVVLVTSGPGILNTLSGVASAFTDGVPLLLIGGEVARSSFGRGALQEGSAHSLNVVAMVSHITKLSTQISEGSIVPTMLRRAMATAMSGRRGPVMLTVPVDISASKITAPRLSQVISTQFSIEEEAIRHAALALDRSRRKLIFAGSGVRFGDGPKRLLELAEKLQCPVMTTPKGKGVFPEDHPLSLGVFGIGGHPSALEFLAEPVETILAIGTSLNDLATNGWSEMIRPTRTLIHVDIDAGRVGRVYPAQIAVAASAELFLEEVTRRVHRSASKRAYGVKRFSDPEVLTTGSDGLISPQRALWELQQVLPEDTTFAIDSGEHTNFAIHYIRARLPSTFMVMHGLAAMGSAIPAAIGIQRGKLSGQAVAVCGDGGFAMTCGEISTASHERLPMVVAVFNDERLGMVEIGHRAHFGRSPDFSVGPMQIGVVAVGLGAKTIQVRKPGEILAARKLLEARRGPVVIDIRIDTTVRMPKNSRLDTLAADIRGRA